MKTHADEILCLMDFWSHCHECGAQLVSVPGGAVCPHCGFELEDPDDTAAASVFRASERRRGGLPPADDHPPATLGQAAWAARV